MSVIEQRTSRSKVVQTTSAAEPASNPFTSDVATIWEPRGARAEAIRGLRTHVMAQHVHEGRKALAVCAASADVGCTLVAVNLAVALSQVGVKTLLVDADLRQPGVDELIRPSRPILGLRHALTSTDARMNEIIEEDVIPDLSVMYSGGPEANAQELLATDRFRDIMEFCLREYDITIIDTPPANICSDARRVSTVVGYSMIVTRRGKTFVDDVKTLISQLEGDHARVVGTVLNEA